MKNNKGQALVEFIIILPVFLLIVLAVIDFGNIISKKYSLENSLDTVTDMYLSNGNNIDSYLNDIGATMSVKEDDEFIKITLNKNVKISSPLVNVIIGKNYNIEVSKSVYKDEIHET